MNTEELSEEPAQSGSRSLLVPALIALACVGWRTISHSAFWLHLSLGRWISENGVPKRDVFSYTMEQKPWINPSWLYDAILFNVWNVGGSAFVIILHVAAVAGAFVLLAMTAKRLAGYGGIALSILLSAWLLTPRFTSQPFILSLIFPAFFIFMLHRPCKGMYLWAALLPAQWLWANMHGSFLLGPVLCLLFAVEKALQPRKEATGGEYIDRLAGLLGLAAAALIVSVLNPHGTGLLKLVLKSLLYPAMIHAEDWISPFSGLFAWPYPKHLVTLAIFVGACGMITHKGKLPIVYTTLAVGSAIFVIRSTRYIEFFALLAFPFFCLSLGALGKAIQQAVTIKPKMLRLTASALVVALSLATAGFMITNQYYSAAGSSSHFGLGVQNDTVPEAAMQLIEQPDFPKRAIHLPMDGGYLMWRLPEHPVFIDQRITLYGTQSYVDLSEALLKGDEAWQHILERWAPGAVILNCNWLQAGAAVKMLRKSDQWTMSYFDGTTAIFLRNVSSNKRLIEDTSYQRAGLDILENAKKAFMASVGGPFRPALPTRLIGAAGVYYALDSLREAHAIYSILADGVPNMISARMTLGICELKMGQSDEAIRQLETVRDRYPKNAVVWCWLSRAYAAADRKADAETAYRRANDINPTVAKSFGDPLKKPSTAE